MYLQTKKVVIIYIVTLITFSSIITSLYRETQDTITQISVVSGEELSFEVSYAQNIYKQFTVDDAENEDVARFGASLYQLSNTSSTQLTNIINASEMTIIVGDTFNEFLEDNIKANTEKQFVLVENSIRYDYENVYQININYDQIYDSITRVANDQNKTLLILSAEYSNLSLDTFNNHEISSNPHVKVEIVNESTEVAKLNEIITEDMNFGFTNVYQLNPYNNIDMIELINSYNQVQLETKEKLTNAAKSETDSEAKAELEDFELNLASLHYLSLNQGELPTSQVNDYFTTSYYDIEPELNKLIDDVIAEKIKSGQAKISITSD